MMFKFIFFRSDESNFILFPLHIGFSHLGTPVKKCLICTETPENLLEILTVVIILSPIFSGRQQRINNQINVNVWTKRSGPVSGGELVVETCLPKNACRAELFLFDTRRKKFSTNLSPSGRIRQVQNTTISHNSGTMNLNSIRISTVRGHAPYKYPTCNTKPKSRGLWKKGAPFLGRYVPW